MELNRRSVTLRSAGAVACRDRRAWQRLANVVRAERSGREVVRALHAVCSDLRGWGLPDQVTECIELGLRAGDWGPAVESFCRQRGAAVNFYLGPMRAMEGDPLSTGLLLLERTPCGSRVVDCVEGLAEDIGRRTFGFPCGFRDRRVEFYDVGFAAGPFVAAAGRCAALFAPAYLGEEFGWKRHALLRRTVLFHNVFRRRFEVLTEPLVADHFRVNGAAPAFVNVDRAEVDEALALWLCMHEMVHASGPLPLFQAVVRKLPLGLGYAGVEEMRVDMTAWLILHTLRDLLPDVALVARDLIAAERVLRSARCGWAANPRWGGIGSDSESENGAFWLAVLIKSGALRNGNPIDVDVDRTEAAIHALLSELYGVEESAAHDGDLGSRALLGFAQDLRSRFFGSADGVRFEVSRAGRKVLGPLADFPAGMDIKFR